METKSLPTLEEYRSRHPKLQFVIDNGQDYGDSRIHICDVYFYDDHYIQQRIRRSALTVREAYQLAVEAWKVATGNS